jgi:hypothetical protein
MVGASVILVVAGFVWCMEARQVALEMIFSEGWKNTEDLYKADT